MARNLYNRDDVLEFVLDDNCEEISNSDDEFVIDVQDEFGDEIFLPEMATSAPAHEREPLLFLDAELNEVSVTIIFVHYLTNH